MSTRAAGGVRLTRRGRLLVSVAMVVLGVTAALLLVAGPVALAGTGRPAAARQLVTVRPGQTVWSIAERAAPGVDPRETVQAILDLNGMRTSEVQAGTALLLP